MMRPSELFYLTYFVTYIVVAECCPNLKPNRENTSFGELIFSCQLNGM